MRHGQTPSVCGCCLPPSSGTSRGSTNLHHSAEASSRHAPTRKHGQLQIRCIWNAMHIFARPAQETTTRLHRAHLAQRGVSWNLPPRRMAVRMVVRPARRISPAGMKRPSEGTMTMTDRKEEFWPSHWLKAEGGGAGRALRCQPVGWGRSWFWASPCHSLPMIVAGAQRFCPTP